MSPTAPVIGIVGPGVLGGSIVRGMTWAEHKAIMFDFDAMSIECLPFSLPICLAR